jgi:MSHA pilin protein MshA
VCETCVAMTTKGAVMRKSQSGFTLIELIVVIAIIAILAAVALPRFAALQAQARIAKMQGAVGAIRSASVMSHALLLANEYPGTYSGDPGTTAPVGNDINVEGVNAIYVFGYPSMGTIAALAGIGAPTETATAATALGNYYVVSLAGGVLTLAPDANHAVAPSACTITYTEAASSTVPPVYNTANLTVANCS